MVKGLTLTSKNAPSLIAEAIQKMKNYDRQMRDEIQDNYFAYAMRQIKGMRPKKLAGMRIIVKKRAPKKK